MSLVAYVRYSLETGEIQFSGVCPIEDINAQRRTGVGFLLGKATGDTHYVRRHRLVAYTPEQAMLKAAPVAFHSWSNDSMSWVDNRTIEEVKKHKAAVLGWAQGTASRKGFTYAGKTVANDSDSLADMNLITNEIMLTGAMPTGWSGTWNATDGTTVSIPNRAAWVAMHRAMVAQRQANITKAQNLKARLAAATTKEEIEAIRWDPE